MLEKKCVRKYTGYQLLIQSKLVDSCCHVTLMHEKTLLIQLNFSPKNWRRVEKTYLIRLNFSEKIDDASKKRIWSVFKLLAGSNTFFRPDVNFSERNLAGSKVFSHASASRDYIGLLDQTLDPRVGRKIWTSYSERVVFGAIPIYSDRVKWYKLYHIK